MSAENARRAWYRLLPPLELRRAGFKWEAGEGGFVEQAEGVSI